ncbi:MAG: arylesterase [Bacteriovoracaceae bacterium]|nr:arylesterase [Bacteriovoracaceae bacterium]
MKLFLLLLIFSSTLHARTILFIGDSLTEGYGIDQEDAFPAQVEKLLHGQGKKDIKVINGGISGSTTANATQRVKWFLKSKPDILVLALGANDGLRGLEVIESEKNLSSAIKLAQENKIKVLLAGMKLPRNYGAEYRVNFELMFKRLAKNYKVPLLDFLLEGVGGVPEYNQADGIHPTAKGHLKVAQNVVKALEPHL